MPPDTTQLSGRNEGEPVHLILMLQQTHGGHCRSKSQIPIPRMFDRVKSMYESTHLGQSSLSQSTLHSHNRHFCILMKEGDRQEKVLSSSCASSRDVASVWRTEWQKRWANKSKTGSRVECSQHKNCRHLKSLRILHPKKCSLKTQELKCRIDLRNS